MLFHSLDAEPGLQQEHLEVSSIDYNWQGNTTPLHDVTSIRLVVQPQSKRDGKGDSKAEALIVYKEEGSITSEDLAELTLDMAFPSSLQTFVANAFYGAVIQDDDKIAEEVYKRDWSPNVQEQDNGSSPINFQQFHDLLFGLRSQFTNRYLVDQSFLIAPAEADGSTGQVAHTQSFTAVQDGKPVTVSSVSVLKIVLTTPTKEEKARRVVLQESFVLTVV